MTQPAGRPRGGWGGGAAGEAWCLRGGLRKLQVLGQPPGLWGCDWAWSPQWFCSAPPGCVSFEGPQARSPGLWFPSVWEVLTH